MDGDPQDDQTPGPATVHEEQVSPKTFRVSFDRHALELLPDEPGMIGYAARWDVVTDRGTVLAKSAFNKTIQDKPATPHLWQHWPDLIIGVNKDGKPDSKGLRIKAALNESDELGARAMGIYRHGQEHGWLPGWSVGFDRIKDRSPTDDEFARFDFSGAGPYKNATIADIRVITEVQLWEVSTVTWGAIHNAGPDVVHGRYSPISLDIAALSRAIREGLIPADQLSQIDELIAARQTRAGADASHSTPPVPSQAQQAAALDLLLFEFGIVTETVAA